MVEANPSTNTGDGVVRNIQYASFRKDKPAAPGYTAELLSDRVDPKFYDNLDAQPIEEGGKDTLLQYFKRNVANRPHEPFLGTRNQLEQLDVNGRVQYGDYTWRSYAEVDRIC